MKTLTDLPPGVIGFELSEKLEAEDYRDILQPALEKAGQDGDVRIVVVIPEFHGMSAEAFWQDLKMGVEHWSKWQRIALVTDIDWMSKAVSIFGWMTPGEVKHFSLSERDNAITWVASD